MYKLIAIDLDGTLLNSYGDISEENKKAIKKAKENNIEIVLSSGRMFSTVKEISKEIEADNYLICGNGAIVYDIQNDKTVCNDCIDIEKVKEIVRICEENNIYYTINTEKYILSKKLNYNLMYYYYENSKRAEKRTTKINIVEDIEKYIEENDIGKVAKITISDESKLIFNGIMKKINEVKGINVLEVSSMSRKIIKSGTEISEISYYYTEITKENVNKWQALKKLSEYINIDTSEIVAIGDNINDMEMIENAGMGIIMGNSALSNKNLSKIIVGSNDSNGVAEAIEKHILKQ